MPDQNPDPELKAIEQVIQALGSLQQDARERVVNYVFQRLGLSAPNAFSVPPFEQLPQASEVTPTPVVAAQHGGVHDIRTFKKSKGPKSDNEMAAVVAYYLKHLAPADEKKDAIGRDDVEKYFVQADFPLPKQPQFTLTNAKNAGYFDRAGTGLYRLNPVGHNLVAHGMGKTAGDTPKERGKREKKKKAHASKPRNSSRKK